MSEKFIKKERAKQLVTQSLLTTLVYYRDAEEKSKFEHKITAIIKRNKVKSKLDKLTHQYDLYIQERRARLHQVLASDDESYKKMMERLIPTPEQQVARMRERVNVLRERKEKERLAFVEEKRMQQWRNNCDDLRDLTSKMMEKQVAAVRDNQLVEQQEKRVKEEQEKKYYERLWEEDRLKKIAREERDRERQKALNEQAALIIVAQVEQLAIKRQEELKLKEEEARLMLQQIEMDKMEQQRKHQLKEHQQRLVRAELDRFNKKKILEKQKQAQEALEADLQMLNRLAELDQQEKEEKARRKLELRREMLSYRDYLVQQKKAAAEFEKELDNLYLAEAERAWRIKSDRMAKEALARDKLMQEVVAVRQQQIQEALLRNQQRQEEVAREKKAIEETIARYEREDREKQVRQAREMAAYQQSLQDQLAELHLKEGKEKERERLELVKEREAEVKYQQLLESEMTRIRNMPIVRGRTI